MQITNENLASYNTLLKNYAPEEIVQWALKVGNAPLLTTNFGPYSSSILHLVISAKKDIKVIWCDSGYNTSYTYRHADEISKRFGINLLTYVPKQTAAQRDILLNGIPSVESPLHKVFSEQVKLEPFRRAMAEQKPDVWFTNLRKGQTAFRDNLDILSLSKDSVLKVSPFYNWSDAQLDVYLEENNLPNETRYFDPTKALGNRECGIHI